MERGKRCIEITTVSPLAPRARRETQAHPNSSSVPCWEWMKSLGCWACPRQRCTDGIHCPRQTPPKDPAHSELASICATRTTTCAATSRTCGLTAPDLSLRLRDVARSLCKDCLPVQKPPLA